MNRDENLSLLLDEAIARAVAGAGLDEAQAQALRDALAPVAEHAAHLAERLAAAEQTRVENADLAAQVQQLQAQLQLRDKRDAVTAALAHEGCRDAFLVLQLIDPDKITLADGAVQGLAEQLQALRKRAPYLFLDSPDPAGGTAAAGMAAIDFDMNTFLRGEN